MPYRGDNFPKVSIRDFPTSSLSLLGLPYRPGLPEEGGVVVRDTCMNVQCCQRGWQILCLYWTGGLADCPSELANWLQLVCADLVSARHEHDQLHVWQ